MNVVNSLVGNSSSFSTGGPGKGMHARTTKNLLNSLYYVDSASSINLHFSDTGIFGLKVSGSNSNVKKIIIDTSNTEGARNLIKGKIFVFEV